MRHHEIEVWALTVIERVRSKQLAEDAKVELKAAWIEPPKAARRIAAHANAARGEPVLWLVGVDERRGVVGATDVEFADWWAQVAACFDGIPPTVTHLAVPVGTSSVVAMVIDSDRAPFVVLNPAFGSATGGPIEREVPWREGSATRSATRSDLLRLLVRSAAMPQFDLLEGHLNIAIGEKTTHGAMGLSLTLYATPHSESLVVIPFHLCWCRLRTPGGKEELARLNNLQMKSQYRSVATGPLMWAELQSLSRTIDFTDSELLVAGPGKVFVSGSFERLSRAEMVAAESLVVELSLRVADGGDTRLIQMEFVRNTVRTGGYAYWDLT